MSADAALTVCDHQPGVERAPRVRAHRVADVLAGRIRDQILDGTLRDGERLPPMEALTRQFGASMTAMREASRILESEGLLTVNRGKFGGAIVHSPDASTAAYTVALALRSRGAHLGDIYQAQSFIEAFCARLCAQRADRKSIAASLRHCNATARGLLDRGPLTVSKPMCSFHEILVRRCGNETLGMLGGILESIYFPNNLGAAENLGDVDSKRVKSATLASLECHEEISELIAAGDDVQVAEKMAKHVASHRHARPRLADEIVDPAVVRMNW